MLANEKRFVYIIRSDADPSRHYTGITGDVAARLDWHNDGPCGCTIHDRPWSLVVAIEFPAEQAARRFEKYLKSSKRPNAANSFTFASLNQRIEHPLANQLGLFLPA